MVKCHHCGAREPPGVPTMCLCGGCVSVSYCDAKCQKADRAAHRDHCNILKTQRNKSLSGPPTLIGDGLDWDDAATYRLLAEAGDGDAMMGLSSCYLVGEGGVDVDEDEAYAWACRAVEVADPSPQAFYNLAQCHNFGHGTPKDTVEAVRLFRIAAEMGLAEAQCKLGIHLKEGNGSVYDPVSSFKWMKRAADAGHAEAQTNVAVALHSGLGVEENTPLAISYYRRAANQGDADAMCDLGAMYAGGLGVPNDNSVAVLWLKRARDTGSARAKKGLFLLVLQLTTAEVHAMGAGVLRALLDGLGVPLPSDAEKPDLVEAVLDAMGLARSLYEEGVGEGGGR